MWTMKTIRAQLERRNHRSTFEAQAPAPDIKRVLDRTHRHPLPALEAVTPRVVTVFRDASLVIPISRCDG